MYGRIGGSLWEIRFNKVLMLKKQNKTSTGYFSVRHPEGRVVSIKHLIPLLLLKRQPEVV